MKRAFPLIPGDRLMVLSVFLNHMIFFDALIEAVCLPEVLSFPWQLDLVLILLVIIQDTSRSFVSIL